MLPGVAAFRSERVLAASAGWKHSCALLQSSEAPFANDFAPLQACDAELPPPDLRLRFTDRDGSMQSLDAHSVVVFGRCPRLHVLAARTKARVGSSVRVLRDSDTEPLTGVVTRDLAMGSRVQVTLAAGGDQVWCDVRDLRPERDGTDGAAPESALGWEVVMPQGGLRKVCVSALLHFLYRDALPLQTSSHVGAELVALGDALRLPRLSALALNLLPEHKRRSVARVQGPQPEGGSASCFAADLRRVLEQPWRHGADAVLVLVDEAEQAHRLLVHRAVLATRSTYLRTLFGTSVGTARREGDGAQLQEHTIRLSDFDLPTRFDVETMRDIVRFCYTNGDDDEDFVTAANATGLLVASDALMLDSLKQRCETEIEFHFLDAEVAPTLLQLCEMMGAQFAPRLALACRRIVGSLQ